MKKKVGLAVLACAMTAAAWARQEYSCTIYYYSDATYTEIVGKEVQTCSGNKPVQGEETPFAVETNIIRCSYSGYECPPGVTCFD